MIKGSLLGINTVSGITESRKDAIYLARYSMHSWTKAAINKVAKSCMRAEVILKPTEGVSDPDLENKRALENLYRNPNPRESFPTMIFRTVVLLKVTGEVYWEVVYNEDGNVTALYILEGDIQPNADEHGNLLKPAYYQKIAGQRAVEFAASEVIEFLMPNPQGGLHGVSDLEALEIAIPSDLAKSKWNRDFFKNNTKPPGLWKLPPGGDPGMVDRNKQEIKAAANAANEGHNSPIVVEGEVDYLELATSPKESEFLDGRRYERDETTAVIGVPLGKLGVTERVNRANMAEQNRNFYEDEIDPILGMLSSTLSNFSADFWEIDDWETFLSSGIHLTADERATLMEKGRDFMKVNEVRTKLLSLPPDPKGNVYLVPEGYKVVESITDTPPPVEKEDENTEKADVVEKKETDLAAVRCYPHGQGCEHDVDSQLGPVQFLHPLAKPADKIANAWVASFDRTLKKLEKKLLSRLKTAIAKGEDYRGLFDEVVPQDAFVKQNIDFLKRAFVEGQKQVAFTGPEDPRVGGLAENPVEAAKLLEGVEQLAEKPLFEIEWSIVPDEEWKVLQASAKDLAGSTVDQMKTGIHGIQSIKDAIRESWEQGLSYADAAKKITPLFKTFRDWQARRIVRSEMNRVFNVARINAMERAGYEYGRVSLGPRPCEICQAKAAEGVLPLAELEEWIQNTHPNEQCVIVGVPAPETKRVVPEAEARG